MERIAIFSDIHGNLQALESIIDDINKEEFDEIIYLGDVIGMGPNPEDCLKIIMDSRIKMVKGNHEIYQLDDRRYYGLVEDEREHRDWINIQLSSNELEYLNNLPIVYEKIINGKLFIFSHFFLNESKDYYESLNLLTDNKIVGCAKNTYCDYMFFGHSHDAFQMSNPSLYTCVGSSGCRKDDTTFYTIVEIDDDVVIKRKEIKYDREKFVEIVNNIDYPRRKEIARDFFGIDVNE